MKVVEPTESLPLTEAEAIALTRLLDQAVTDTGSNSKARVLNRIIRRLDRMSVERVRAQKARR